MKRAVHVVISGRVQGVGYREWTRREASSRGLEGWVRNRHDGSVEAVFAGEDSRVESMLLALRVGPPSARVGHIEVVEGADEEPAGFTVRETG